MDRTPTTDRNLARGMCRRGGPIHLGLLLMAVVIGPRPVAAEPTVIEPVRPDLRVEDDDADEAQAFFDGPYVPQLRVDVGEAGLASLRKEPRKPVRATVVERVGRGSAAHSTVYRDVAVHLKGGSGSFRKVDERPCLTLDFRQFHPTRLFHGLEKVHLNNSVQDPTYMEEILCGELFRAAGVPAARGTVAAVWLNGRGIGLAVLKEGFDKDFLHRNGFRHTHGNLYDGGWLTDIDKRLHRTGGRNDVADHSDLAALAAAANEPDVSARFERMAKLLDVDRFISFMAMEVVAGHVDGYTLNMNNYRVYHDPKADRIVFFAHGMDQMFYPPARPAPADGGGAAADPMYPTMKGLVARQLLATQEGRRRYEARVDQVLRDVYHVDRLHERVDQLREKIRPALEELDPPSAKLHDGLMDGLKQKIAARADDLRPPQVVTPDTPGE